MPDEPEVSYTVKELLSQLNSRIDAFMTLLGSKADQTVVAHVVERVDQLDTRVGVLETDGKATAKHFTAKQDFRRWVVPTVISVAAVVVAILQAVHP